MIQTAALDACGIYTDIRAMLVKERANHA